MVLHFLLMIKIFENEKTFVTVYLILYKISPREKFEDGQFMKISIREIFGKG